MKSGYILSVTQLNEYVASLMGNDMLLSGLSLKGEISGFKRHTSGHLYFTLKDEKSLVRCVMFRQNAMGLDIAPRDGMQIVASGYASLYTRDGQYQFYVKSMESAGEGELYRRFLALKAKLEDKGLFAADHKKELPRLPRCVGVVTSATGAAIQDIINITRRRYPGMNIILRPAKVQGEGAAADIAQGIRELEADGRADVIIVGRGGGSLEDLWAFNEEVVAKAIYDCSVPVVSAVGHETDFTIADFTADMRAPTPSAAAELCVPEYEAESDGVEALRASLSLYAGRCLDAERAKIDFFTKHSAFTAPRFALREAMDELDRLATALTREYRDAVTAQRGELDGLKSSLEGLSPARTLERGYALIRTQTGFAGSIEALSVGQSAQIFMLGGSADVTVDAVNKSGGHNG